MNSQNANRKSTAATHNNTNPIESGILAYGICASNETTVHRYLANHPAGSAKGKAARVPGNKSCKTAAPKPNCSSKVVGHSAKRFANSPTTETVRKVNIIAGKVNNVALMLVANTTWMA